MCAAGLMLLCLAGCIEPAFFVATEVAPRAVNGKGLAEDGADAVTGKDCRLVEGTVHKDRKLCETRGSPATDKDFKGLMGHADRQDAGDPAASLPIATP
jgi:hypothetical protein